MVRAEGQGSEASGGFPHPRGDGPCSFSTVGCALRFSPPAWGWSDLRGSSRRLAAVFPTRVGMVRTESFNFIDYLRFPHPRGDGPRRPVGARGWSSFSPPAWGWSAAMVAGEAGAIVFPTRVGMVRISGSPPGTQARFPHPRGDGPHPQRRPLRQRPFSPPAWGWSGTVYCNASSSRVFPTRVGMVRGIQVMSRKPESFPHPRGDGPQIPTGMKEGLAFSPPAWGWSVTVPLDAFVATVFPTRVGMVRPWICPICNKSRFPHPRGDGPEIRYDPRDVLAFSPPAWGWSDWLYEKKWTGLVFPTRVGMVRQWRNMEHMSECFPHPRGDGPASVRIAELLVFRFPHPRGDGP